MIRSACLLAIVGLLSIAVRPGVAAAALSITEVGRYDFTDSSGSGAAELSGIAYAGGNQYYAVSDQQAQLFTLNIGLNNSTGAITSASINSASLQLNDESGVALSGSDREDIVFDGTNVWIANETGPELSQHSLTTGNRLAQITTTSNPQLNVFNNIRNNYSWESLARTADGSAFWTANEGALDGDGELATYGSGSVVRLQKFDAAMNPAGQWAYEADAIDGGTLTFAEDRNGVVDLLALDSGDLLVMERSFGDLHFKLSLYEVDFTGATDISQGSLADGLIGETFTPVSKNELWSHSFSLLDDQANFEGLTLGATLDDGSRSLILVADNGGGTSQSLYALKLSGVVPEPSTWMLLLAAAIALAVRYSRRRS